MYCSGTMHLYIFLITAVIASLLLYRFQESWRPFAWYGYPGTRKGSVGYQARGDWCGVTPATRTVDKPIPLIAPENCHTGSC